LDPWVDVDDGDSGDAREGRRRQAVSPTEITVSRSMAPRV